MRVLKVNFCNCNDKLTIFCQDVPKCKIYIMSNFEILFTSHYYEKQQFFNEIGGNFINLTGSENDSWTGSCT